jgi:hypothetical protein
VTLQLLQISHVTTTALRGAANGGQEWKLKGKRLKKTRTLWDLKQKRLLYQLARARESAVGIASEEAQGSQDVSQAGAAAEN